MSLLVLWRDHSLTIIMVTLGVVLISSAFIFEAGRTFDLLLGLGQGVLTASLVFFLSQFFREKAKPEDPPQ